LRKIVPECILRWYHFGWACLGAIVYGFPARNMTIIGVTGTDGKSTTTEMIARIFSEAGYKTCSTSSVWFQIGDAREKNHLKMGMPGRMFLYKFLRNAARQGCTHAVVEVSSEGILQSRHRFLNFHTAVITNLSPEHIERHGSFEKYRAEKQKLFRAAKKVHVLNTDDENARYFLRIPSKEIYAYGLKKEQHFPEVMQYISAENIVESKEGTNFLVNGIDAHLNLIGRFNAYNALAAICAGKAHGISLDVCVRALARMPRMPGRTEPIITKPFIALIDYAVTPKAFENLYKGTRRLFQPKRMICVFGACGGGRDKWKRPILGSIASVYCDHIILTNEDPYDEDPNVILDQIAEGIQGDVRKIVDRRKAIREALSMAKEGDVVVVSGKGSEDSIAMDGEKIPWNEAEVVREEFATLDK